MLQNITFTQTLNPIEIYTMKMNAYLILSMPKIVQKYISRLFWEFCKHAIKKLREWIKGQIRTTSERIFKKSSRKYKKRSQSKSNNRHPTTKPFKSYCHFQWCTHRKQFCSREQYQHTSSNVWSTTKIIPSCNYKYNKFSYFSSQPTESWKTTNAMECSVVPCGVRHFFLILSQVLRKCNAAFVFLQKHAVL